jgi:hypothetical protein
MRLLGRSIFLGTIAILAMYFTHFLIMFSKIDNLQSKLSNSQRQADELMKELEKCK